MNESKSTKEGDQDSMTHPDTKAYLQLWGLVGLLWFLFLVALMFVLGETYWIITAVVLVGTMTAIAYLQAHMKTDQRFWSVGVPMITAIIVTAVVTIIVSEYLNPARDMTDHFVALVNPYWTILVFLWILLRKDLFTFNER